MFACWIKVLVFVVVCCIFFFKQKTAYEMRISDWSSDVCSSDLLGRGQHEDGLQEPISPGRGLWSKWLAATGDAEDGHAETRSPRCHALLRNVRLTLPGCGNPLSFGEADGDWMLSARGDCSMKRRELLADAPTGVALGAGGADPSTRPGEKRQ